MPVSLSIKNVPDVVVERLRARALRNHRSMQGEMMAILEAALATDTREEGGAASVATDEGPARAVRPDPRRGVATTDDALALMREDARAAIDAAQFLDPTQPDPAPRPHDAVDSTTPAKESSL